MKILDNLLLTAGTILGGLFLYSRMKVFQGNVSKVMAEDITELSQEFEKLAIFDTGLYQSGNYGYAKLVPRETVVKWANQIVNSNFDDELIFFIFEQPANKLQISQLSDAYNNLTGRDLRLDLLNKLNDKERAYLFTIINKKPLGK